VSKLSGDEIEMAVRDGRLYVDPFHSEWVGPNSIDLRLGPELVRFAPPSPLPRAGFMSRLWRRVFGPRLDPELFYDTHESPDLIQVLPESDGAFWLVPGVLYLGHTAERIALFGLAGTVMGRSTTARYGVTAEVSAGFIDDGFGDSTGEDGRYGSTITLEITVIHPIRVYPGDRFCQLTIEPVVGPRRPYGGSRHHYQGQVGPRGPSSMAD
jgi:dCTP deaminase